MRVLQQFAARWIANLFTACHRKIIVTYQESMRIYLQEYLHMSKKGSAYKYNVDYFPNLIYKNLIHVTVIGLKTNKNNV